jgi:hypothetical protein
VIFVLTGDIHTRVASQVGLVFTLEVLVPGIDVSAVSFLIGLDVVMFTII